MFNKKGENMTFEYKVKLDPQNICLENILKAYSTNDLDALTMTVKAVSSNEAKKIFIEYVKAWDNVILYTNEVITTPTI